MKHIFRRGLPVVPGGAPVQQVRPANVIRTVALMGADHPGLRFDVLVSEGQQVAAGDPLMADRKRPEIRFTAPVAGKVAAIATGPRRSLSELRLELGGYAARRFDLPGTRDGASVRALLLESGLWPAFRRRPYGGIPDPDATPDAIFVTATDTRPLAPRPDAVLEEGARDAFARGAAFLRPLTPGPVFVCQGKGPPLVSTDAQIRVAYFTGAEPAGQPGTHIDRLFPVRHARTVWQIGYQDVIALGLLLETGTLPGTRVIALAGPGVLTPRLVRVPIGASIAELTEGELTPGAKTVLSGPPIGGAGSDFLRLHHLQVTVLSRRDPPRPAGAGWLPARARRLRPAPFVPTRALECALGSDLPVVPLLRALSVGDAETAARLGVRALLEDDMALATYAAGGGHDFAGQLRRILDRLEAET